MPAEHGTGRDEGVVQHTRSAYDRGATAFTDRTRDRSRIRPRAERFAREVRAGGVVADVGCGPGHDSRLLRELGLRAAGLEYSAGMLLVARSEHPGPLAQADMRRLPLRDGVCDGLWVNASLLHVPRDDVPGTLSEFARALVPGGVLFLSLKRGKGEGWRDADYAGMPRRWFTFWSAPALDEALGTAGFDVFWSDEYDSMRTREAWLARLARKRS